MVRYSNPYGGLKVLAIAGQPKAAQRLLPQPAEEGRIPNGAREELEIVPLEDASEFLLGVITGGGGAVAMFHHGRSHINRGPAALPRAITKVQVFDIGGCVGFIDAAQGAQLFRIIEGAASAAVEDVSEIFALQRFVAADRKI